MIPIIIICFNNYKYVENIINQIININELLVEFITIVNNNSNEKDTIEYLNNSKINIINNDNIGPWISQYVNEHIYNKLPDQFILTDPDLEFNVNLPKNFIEIMISLSNKYMPKKIGFAINIDDTNLFYENINIEHEKDFWINKIEDDYELYQANIDTTFCLINKNGIENYNIRIAGNFTCKHLPWYKNNIMNTYETFVTYNNTSFYYIDHDKYNISTNSEKILDNIEKNYLKIHKNNAIIFVKNDINNSNLNFWKNIYNDWENDTFEVFDNNLDKNKIFIDIGGWIGTTCIYASRYSKSVIVIEADKESFEDLKENSLINSNNIIFINKCIYNENDIDIMFGSNNHIENSKLNDSTSQICFNYKKDSYKIKTITIQQIINENNIKPDEISLIKVDIEGGEEFILEDLYNIKMIYNTKIYVSFHYDWWRNKDLNRFNKFLDEEKITKIQNYPFISLLL
jgi:FkbM family methyltransferase